MIQAKELRLGNWVINTLDESESKYQQVSGIFHDKDGFRGYAIQFGVGRTTLLADGEDSFIEPIPLTPDILEKAGFTILEANTYIIKDPEFPHDNYAAIGEYSICRSRDGQWMIMNGCGNTEYIVLYIDYVHELQNWHYLTTGTDLPLTFN